ncbi:MAG: hypothetical protein GF331_18710 [Chitinivibrionales bacterium]|nr:hypothetical protein [Chitinivibrionales bacterium]
MKSNSNLRSEFTRRDHVLEIFSAILLSLTTVASSWSAYQATRWSGVQATSFSEAGSLRTKAAQLTTEGAQKVGIDVAMFIQFVEAYSNRDTLVFEFLLQRFRPEFKKVVDEWIALRPLQNPDAPPSPFALEGYSVAELREARRLNEEADGSFERAKQANQTGDNYILLTVVFASVLFFSGIATKFEAFYLRVVMISLGGVVFLAAAVVLSRFPVH